MNRLLRLRSFGVLFAAGLSTVLSAGSFAETVATMPRPTTYVSDFANVMDAASKQSIEDLAGQVAAKAHATIVVVTVTSLEGQSIEEFATALEDKWKVGPKGSDKGVLMLFSIGDRKRRIEVGYGLEGILNDAKVGDIGRAMVPDLQAGAYGAGALLGVQQIANVIAADAGVTLTAPQQAPEVYHRQRVSGHSSNWLGLVVFVVIFLIIVGGRGGRGGGGWMWFLLGSFLGGGGRGGGGFSGGEGGGGSSGGGDFGGGFGGGSGGGGASGDW